MVKKVVILSVAALIVMTGIARADYIPVAGMTGTDSSHYGGRGVDKIITDHVGWEPTGPGTMTADGAWMWLVDNVVISEQWARIDLGAVYALDSITIWNYNEAAGAGYTTRGIENMNILAATTEAGLTTATPVVLTNLAMAPGNQTTPYGETISLGGVSARYVELDLVSCFGGYDQGYAGLSAVRFTEVPEPATMLLLGVSSLLLRRRRRS